MKTLWWYLGIGAGVGAGILIYKFITKSSTASPALVTPPQSAQTTLAPTKITTAVEKSYDDKLQQVSNQAQSILDSDVTDYATLSTMAASFRSQADTLDASAKQDTIAGKISQSYYSYIHENISQLKEQVINYMDNFITETGT